MVESGSVLLTCAFCGAQYASGVSSSGHRDLTAHVLACPRHPMRIVEQKLDALTHAVLASREAAQIAGMLHGAGESAAELGDMHAQLGQTISLADRTLLAALDAAQRAVSVDDAESFRDRTISGSQQS